MLSYKRVVERLANMQACDELSGGHGQIGSELYMVSMIFEKDEDAILADVEKVYPAIFRELAGV